MWWRCIIVVQSLLLTATLLGKCEDIPDNPTISKTQNGSALTCPVVFGVNQTVSIWCKAENMNGSRKLQGLFWRDNNGSRVYSKGHSNNSNPDVYSVQNAGNVSNFTSTRIWIRALHFSRIQPSYAGTYKCTANYNKLFVNETVEVRIEATAIDCGDPGTPTKGQRILCSTTYNSVVNYTCDVGYTLQGSNSRTCQDNGNWSGSVPKCNNSCGDPGTPANGKHNLTSTTYNSAVTYTCGVGYTLLGSNSRTCQSNGQWSGSVPQCELLESNVTSSTSSSASSTNKGTTNSASATTSSTPTSNNAANGTRQSTGPLPTAAIVSVVIAVLLSLGCVLLIALVAVMFKKRHSGKTFHPEVLYDVAGMECVQHGAKKAAVVVADSATSDFRKSRSKNWHNFPVTKETGEAEVAIVAEADTTQVSQAQFEAQDEAPPGIEVNVQVTVALGKDTSALKINQFVEHVKRMHVKRDKGFEEEFKRIIDDPKGVQDIAKANHSKNRYHNIHTFDHSRVVLSVPDGWGSDYINASYINGKGGEVYIASQGPTPETITDFWQMIWDVRPAVIVMLTKVKENGKRKCEKYWTDDLDQPYNAGGGFTVVTTGCRGFADYVIRDLAISSASSRPHCVKQFQYTSWPDHGVPLQTSSLVKFIQQARKEFEGTDLPIVVHCSAGVGRTGTFITLDVMMERLKERKDIDIFGFVSEMRTRRTKMVQTLDQYVFIHDALSDYITCGDTSVPAHELRAVIATFERVDQSTGRSGFQEQFAMLEKLCKSPCSEDFAFARKRVVAKRNRYKDKFPYSTNFLRLPYSSASNGTDYINATFTNSYSSKRAFIAAQSPMENTMNDIWELIWQFRTSTIVLLCGFMEGTQETCSQFWPDEGTGTADFKLVKVNYIDTFPMKDCDKIVLDVFSTAKLTSPPMEVVLYHFRGWTTTSPPPAASLLKVMGEVADVQKADRPVLVMCDDGMSRSGVFITCMSEIERIKVEGGVDIFQTVKAARAQRPHMVYTSDQYKLCFEILQSYLDSFDAYANFKDI